MEPPAGIPLTLRLAAVVVTIETIVEAVAIARRDELTPGLRVMLLLFLLPKAVLAWRATHLKPGAALGVLLYESTTVVAALGATTLDPVPRMALAASGVVAIVLMLLSLRAFPTVELPRT